ncbi:transcription factor/nuclear export subunit protein 2-domain-containing protein [Nemania sp. FL0916]|nr:transcription factor/nuclear export subunit protein 2-domain-containing protein [Nemania sp. FL0916]
MPPKRKRNERVSEASGRPSPHRPSDSSLAQHDRDHQDGSQHRRGPGGARNMRRNMDRRDSSGPQGAASSHRVPVSPATARPSSSSSQTTPAVPQFAPPAVVQPAQPPRTPMSNYNYLVLTEARLSTWHQSGRQEVIEHGITSRQDEDIEEISTISQEFTRAVLENCLTPGDAGNCMKQILGLAAESGSGTNFAFDAQTLFLDTISVFLDSNDAASTAAFRDFIAATELSPQLVREVLDAPALQQLGLIRDNFVKLGIKYATNQLYRQANYNLLREESEGYSKLAAELYRTPYQSQGHHDSALVQASWERIKALIGTFDLDVGRVLDVVIDVFSATMLRNLIFFTRLLRISSWWPRNQIEHAEKLFAGGLPKWALPQNGDAAVEDIRSELDVRSHQRDLDFWNRAREIHLDAFFELGGRQIEDAELQRLHDSVSESDSSYGMNLEWMKTTKTLPPCGNRVAAQVLGFKFRFYTSAARDKGETLPANLYYLAAFLIKIGFISLTDLYPHLWPADEDMDALRHRREEELAEKERSARQGGAPNALLTAGALTDDTIPMISKVRESSTNKVEGKAQETNGQTQEDESALPEPKEAQKADIVSHLLVVGAIPEALFIIGRFPWLPEAYPDEIYPAINRILTHSINKVYESSRPSCSFSTSTACVKPDLAQDQAGMPKGKLRLVEGSPIKVLRWPHADGTSKGILYRFYLDEWFDNVPVCETVDDVFTLCHTLLNISGVNIGRDPTLVKKLASIGVQSLIQDTSSQNISRWQDLLRRTLVPSLCLTNANVDAVAAVWDLLKNYPTQARYNIYAECYEGSISRLEAMKQAFKAARSDTLATLKRLSLENISMSAKKLAKIALSSPGVVCKVALDQIEAYTNLIEAFVECTKYFTEMGHDVLVWSLLSSLGGKQRSRTQETSILLTSRWLQALSKFSGKVFRRYENVNSTPVIQYVNEQVATGKSTDLVILRDLITSMAGIVPDVDFTDGQLAALGGGELLRRQTLIGLGDKRYESEKSASRLMQALLQANMASQLLVNMAQYRQSTIYQLSENAAHIKYLATVVDDSQQALVQYIELLRHNLSAEEFDSRVPGIPSLMTDLGLDANLAFLIGRASLTYYLTGPGDKVPIKPAVDGEGNAPMDTNGGSNGPIAADDAADQMAVDGAVVTESGPEQLPPSVIQGQSSDRFLDVLNPIIEAVKSLYPQGTWEKISPEFFVLFWALQTSDLEVPIDSYKAEFSKLDKERDELKRDRSDMSRSGANRKEIKMAAIERLSKELPDEASICKERVTKTKLLLIKQSPIWFNSSAKAESVVDTFIEECLLPRTILSPGDADFCHRMIRFLHFNRVSNFRLSALYNRLFNVNRLRSMIFSCTVREAEFLGRFIKLTLGELSLWHTKRDAYEKEAIGHGRLGFATTLDESGKPLTFMAHDEFRDLLWTWHRNLFAALKSCLGDTEWMHIRNAITILKAGLEYFPSVDFMGRQLNASLAKIAEREAATKNDSDDGQGHRVDLAVTANTAISALKKRSSKWVMVQEFRPNTSGDAMDDKKGMEIGKGSQSSALRPSAPEFKPQSTGISTRTKPGLEEEDGEVKDGGASLANSQAAAAGNVMNTSLAHSASSQRQGPVPLTQKADSKPVLSRPTTPGMVPTSSITAPSGRLESGRPSTLAPMPSGMHGLPSRPEVPFPAHFSYDKFGTIKTLHPPRDHKDHRDGRDHRDPRDLREMREPRDLGPRDARDLRDPRSHRLQEDSRPPRQRDYQVSDRRVQEPPTRDSHRLERDRPPHRPDSSRLVETGPQDRDLHQSRDRSSVGVNIPRGVDASREAREIPAPVKQMPTPQSESPGPTVNPERARLINADRPDDRSSGMNLGRVTRLNDSRYPREDSRDRNSARVASPRRGDRSESHGGESSRDERRMHRGELHAQGRDQRSEPQSTVTRSSRAADHEGDRPGVDRPRGESLAFSGQPSSNRGEPEQGRLNMLDPEYGRLSSIPSIGDMGNPPEGPRGRGRNTTRGPGNIPQTRPEPRQLGSDGHRPASPERHHPPTGPSMSRQRRNQNGLQHVPIQSSSVAPGPGTLPGMHPERLRQMNPNTGGNPLSTQPSYAPPIPTSTTVHPDRIAQIVPQSTNTNNSHMGGRPHPPPLQTPDRVPLGMTSTHRPSPASLPNVPGTDNSPMSAPTGPAAANDRSRNGRRQLSGINSILQGGPNVRPKGSRTNLVGSDAQVLTGASPVSTPTTERSEPFPPKERSNRSDHERGRREHDPSERSSRSQRRSSLERSSDRDHRPKDHREYRERKSGMGSGHGREGEKDPLRRSGREQNAARESVLPRNDIMGNSRDGIRELRHRGDGGNSRHEEIGRVGGGRGGDRRELRTSAEDHRNRKRRSEEFGGPVEKRARR